MRLLLLLSGAVMIGGCAFFDIDEDPPASPAPTLAANASCTDLWKRYSDEVRLIEDDRANWQAHDDNALQYLGQFAGSCNAADTREAAASDLRCKALWDIYVKEVGQMTKNDRTWREHDLQQTEAMNRIRTSCDKTACTLLPGIRCNVPTNPS